MRKKKKRKRKAKNGEKRAKTTVEELIKILREGNCSLGG
jgi:hypothetical protein